MPTDVKLKLTAIQTHLKDLKYRTSTDINSYMTVISDALSHCDDKPSRALLKAVKSSQKRIQAMPDQQSWDEQVHIQRKKLIDEIDSLM